MTEHTPSAVQPSPSMAEKRKAIRATLMPHFYHDYFYALVFLSSTLGLLLLIMLGWAYYESSLQESPKEYQSLDRDLKNSQGTVVVSKGALTASFPMTADGKLHYPSPLSEPSVNTPGILEWCIEAISSGFSFTFIDYVQVINDASLFFTKSGYQDYRTILMDDGIINNVIQKKYVLSMKPVSAPIILKEALSADGSYSWQLQFSMHLSFQNLLELSKSEWIVTMLVIRVPQNQVPHGLAIAALILRRSKG